MTMEFRLIRNIIFLLTILVCATSWLYFLYMLSGPDDRIAFPRDLEELQKLRQVLEEYVANRLFYTIIFFSSAYLYKQSFAIPGSVFMNLLSGALFGVGQGFLMCCALSAFGASSCFLLSKTFGRPILMKVAPKRIEYFRSMIEQKDNEKDLFKYLLGLRIFPMTPNWLINMASPQVGVPLKSFFLSVLIGLAPYNFLSCNAGSYLAQLKSVNDVMSWQGLLGLGILATVVIDPVKIYHKLKCKRASEEQKAP